MFGTQKPQTPPALQPAPSFGTAFGTPQQPAASPSGFGAGAPSTPSLFGATTTAASQPQFSFNNFGAASSTPTLFGAASAQSMSAPSFTFPTAFAGNKPATTLSTPGSFPSMLGGAQPQQQTNTFGSAWGQKPLGQSTPSLFGGVGTGLGAQPQQMTVATPGSLPGFPPFPSDTGHLASSQVANDLQALDAAFNPKPTNNSYRFRHLFTNVVTSDQSVSLASKPANVDGVQWQEAVDEVESLESLTAANRPANEKLWPVGVGYAETSGFQDLIVRAQSQEAEIAKHKEFLERVQGTIASITRKHEVDIQKAVQNCRAKYEEQTHKLIHIMRFVDFLEHRAFRHPFTTHEDELAKKLARLQNAFQEGGTSATTMAQSGSQNYPSYLKPSPQGSAGQSTELTELPKRIEALAALAREVQAHKKAKGQVHLTTTSDNLVSGFSPENCEKICNTLSKYLEAVNKVQTSLQRDLVHLDIMEKMK